MTEHADKYWPVWMPIPRRPWKLVNAAGEDLRDKEGHTIQFNTGQQAIKYAQKHNLLMEVPQSV